jgi:hypothetical protein
MSAHLQNALIEVTVDSLRTWLHAMVMDGLSAHVALNIGANMEQLAF